MTQREPLPPINFAALADALLARIDHLVPMWLPGGSQLGHEYRCGSLSGGSGTSCSVNLTNGKWSDFATGEAGGDLVSLYAAINGLTPGKAAVQVARDEGLEDVANVQRGGSPGEPAAARPLRPAPEPKAPHKSDEGWRSTMLVPPTAPAATFKHQHRAFSEIEHTATYRMDGQLLGYVVRFRTSDGGKETLPYTWCTSARDGASRWHWKTWDEPRPLYFPGGESPGSFILKLKPPPTVVLVEGEKKADILQALLDAGAPGVYLVASWAGGCKAWKKACWAWLAETTVLLWPDCDGKREPLTKKERDACLDDVALAAAQAMKPLLPVDKQPGMSAMLGIGALLRDAHKCTVQLLPIPEPLVAPDGWDCADAIVTDGWDFERVLAFFASAYTLPGSPGEPATATALPANAESKKIDGPGNPVAGDDAFQDYLTFLSESLKCKIHELGVNRKMIIKALRTAPALQDCLGYNELTGAPSTRLAWPWRPGAMALKDTDDLALGDYLCTNYKLKAASRAALSEAIETVADQRRFHPVRDWLEQQKHDGKERIDKWLIYVLGMDPDKLPPKRKRYLEMVGRFLLIGLIARVMEPGCKFDYSPVFEGKGGIGKSTFFKTLVSVDFFSDTHFDIGSGKDGFEQLEGLWGYELSELTALRKADSEQVKQFFSSQIDRFRGAYGKYVQAHPRQCVIFCSTNKKVYLYDLTGNRRFWPIWIDEAIKIEWLQKYRGQLYAEAFALFKAGERYAPTREEEDIYFVPEQEARMVETAVQSRLYELLTREGAPVSEGKVTADLNLNTTFITLDRLVSALGADAAKSSSLLETQIRGWLEAHGWVSGRESTGQRRRGFKQPAVWPPKIEEEESAPPGGTQTDGRPTQAENHEGSDDEPF